MNVFKAIVTDLDGTLLNSESKVGVIDTETLIGLKRQGIIIIIATGRSIFSFKRVIPEGFPADWLIFDAGAGILDIKTGEQIFSSFMTREEVLEIAAKLTELQLDFQIRNRIPDSHLYFYKKFSHLNPDFDRINEMYKAYNKELKSLDELSESSRIISIAPNDGIVDVIEKEFPEYSIIRATSPVDYKSVWMEIYPKGINKGSALRLLCSKLNLKLSDTIGFGNDYNDVHFLDIVGDAYLVSNSPEALNGNYKKTASNNDNPLNEVLKGYLVGS
jgi:hypothetical protein